MSRGLSTGLAPQLPLMHTADPCGHANQKALEAVGSDVLDGYDVLAAVALAHAVANEELQVVLVLRVAVAVDVHHQRVWAAPKVCHLQRAGPVAVVRRPAGRPQPAPAAAAAAAAAAVTKLCRNKGDAEQQGSSSTSGSSCLGRLHKNHR